MSLRAALLLVSLAGLWPACSRAGESPDAVAAAVQQAAQALAPPDATLSLGPVSGASYMQTCIAPLSVSMGGTAPYEQALVHCPAPVWSLYISVTVAQTESVVVAARPVAAGQTLGPGDLMLSRLPVQQFAGRPVFFDPAQLIGATASMSLAAGMVLTQDAVQEPLLVKAGQTVTVRVISGGVVLSLDATADQDGRIGDTILLTNPVSGRRFTAQVTADGPQVQLQ